MPELVANHLGRHGGAEHLPHLTRGARTLRDRPEALAVQALVRLRAPGSIDLVRGSFDRRDFDEECWSGILEALAERSDPPALQAGAFEASATTLAETVRQRALSLDRAAGDDLVDRIVEVASFWADPEVARSIDGLGPHLREWVIGFLISTVVKMARYRNHDLEVRRAAGDLGALLSLLEIETSMMADALPPAVAQAVEAAGPAGSPSRSAARRAAEERCLAILAARGPF